MLLFFALTFALIEYIWSLKMEPVAQTVDKTNPGWYATEYNENRGDY